MIDNLQWDKLKYHEQQSRLWRTRARLVNVVAGRGSGKTTLARRRVTAYLPVKKPWANPMYFYALPTYKQARRVAFKHIGNLVPKRWLASPIKHDMIIRTIFGSELHIVGLDAPERLEGDQWDGGVVDEASDQKPGWWKSMRPALAHRKGWIWEIGVPKRTGKGAREFRNRYLGDEWESYHWTSETVLPEEEIEAAKREMSEKDYREQFGATWESAGGAAFHAFNADFNVARCKYQPNLPIYLGCDFNVNPMCWVLGHVYDKDEYTPGSGRLEIFDELYMADTNTQESLDALWQRYGKRHKAGFRFYGDASSSQRRTSASKSDYVQIQNDPRLKPIVRFPKSNPPVKDRLASCNAMFQSAIGDVRCLVDKSCVHLIDDITARALNDMGSPDEKPTDMVGHMTDGLGYLIHGLFPIIQREYGDVEISIDMNGV